MLMRHCFQGFFFKNQDLRRRWDTLVYRLCCSKLQCDCYACRRRCDEMGGRCGAIVCAGRHGRPCPSAWRIAVLGGDVPQLAWAVAESIFRLSIDAEVSVVVAWATWSQSGQGFGVRSVGVGQTETDTPRAKKTPVFLFIILPLSGHARAFSGALGCSGVVGTPSTSGVLGPCYDRRASGLRVMMKYGARG